MMVLGPSQQELELRLRQQSTLYRSGGKVEQTNRSDKSKKAKLAMKENKELIKVTTAHRANQERDRKRSKSSRTRSRDIRSQK